MSNAGENSNKAKIHMMTLLGKKQIIKNFLKLLQCCDHNDILTERSDNDCVSLDRKLFKSL